MPEFSVNTHRKDPYKNFKFRIKWDGKYIAGVSKISALKRTTEVVEFRNGFDVNQVRKSPGRTRFEPIIIERGVTHDMEFENWANKTWSLNNNVGTEASLKDFRKDIVIELLNETGQIVMAFNIFRCWVSEFSALPDLDANNGAVAIQSITIQNEGWERDYAVAEPAEISINIPKR